MILASLKWGEVWSKYRLPLPIGPLQDAITWYKIRHTGTQTAHWDIQNKEDLSLSDLSRFVLDVPVRGLGDFVPCDRVLQRAYSASQGTCVRPKKNCTDIGNWREKIVVRYWIKIFSKMKREIPGIRMKREHNEPF